MNAEQNWYSEEAATFGDRLAGAREAAGLSQTQLAKQLGVKLKTLKSWEDDLSEPRANRVQMLSGILNVSLMWLLTGEGDGLDGPAEAEEVPAETGEIINELRLIKADMSSLGGRLSKLEKRLRKSLETAP